MKVAELVSEISAASTEQAEGINQVNKAVVEMDKVVQQSAANAEELASASEETNAQAEMMRGNIVTLKTIISGDSKLDDSGFLSRKKKSAPGEKHATKALAIFKKNKGQKAEPEQRGTAKVRPEDVIPFDDSEFKDF